MTASISSRAVGLAALALATSIGAGAAQADIFMKIVDTPGDASARGFEQQISLIGASLSISNSLNSDPSERANPDLALNVTPISITKTPDRSSPKLMLDAVKGKPLGVVEITFTSQPKPGAPQVIEARWILEGAEVRSFQVFPDTSGTPRPTTRLPMMLGAARR